MHRNYTAPVHRGPVLDPSWSRKDSDNKVPQQAMSTKILGLGLFLVGVLLLSVALIIGLEFPKYVRTKIIEDQCILNKDHSKFESWVSRFKCFSSSECCVRAKSITYGTRCYAEKEGKYMYTE